jgi:hypothetical protein
MILRQRFILLLLLTVLLPLSLCKGQQYSRIRADFSVKVKTPSGGQSLTMGQVFYDRNLKQLIYYLSFPGKEIWITSDTMVYQIRNEKLISKTATFSLTDFTVFHLALNSHLQDFGLKNTTYKAEQVKRENNLVITTWRPPEKAREKLGNILVSVKNKQLFGVIFQDPKGIVIRKQFFEEYQVINGLSFPGKIIEINITNGIESYQVTTYKNVVVDEMENDSKYFYNTSGLRL